MISSNPDLIVVDVRGLSEYCSETADPPGHIPGALLHPWNSELKELEGYEELPAHGDILVYCGMNIRSPQAANFLCTHGFTSVSNMTEGFSQWPYATVGCVDTDDDGINDDLDPCTDTDQDGFGDPGFALNTCHLDNCPNLANSNQLDGDGDCIGDACDTEPVVYDPLTIDSYPPGGNDCGDLCECEGNFDGDADVDGTDAAAFRGDFGRSTLINPCTNALPCNGDFECDKDVDGGNASRFKGDFGRNAYQKPCPDCITNLWCVYP